jgi:hypothetical protein
MAAAPSPFLGDGPGFRVAQRLLSTVASIDRGNESEQRGGAIRPDPKTPAIRRDTMSELETTKIQLTFELPEELSRPEKVATATTGITIVNDTNRAALVLVSNHLSGPASVGYVKPNHHVVMPCGWAWWDVYVLFEGSAELFIVWTSLITYEIRYNRKKAGVGFRDTVRISQM